jgi:hypothetical protein
VWVVIVDGIAMETFIRHLGELVIGKRGKGQVGYILAQLS